MKMAHRTVVIAGAGPVGMVAAADLVRQGVAVTVIERNPSLSKESRASTFHPPTLDMLDRLGFAKPLIEKGLRASRVQYGSTVDGELATFDFATIADLTHHPYRLQVEQHELTRVVLDALIDNPLFEIRFDTPLRDLRQDACGVELTLDTGTMRCDWLIGADGANSAVRRSQGISFEGFTWPERFLVITTPVDIAGLRRGIEPVSYWADPQCWHFLLRIVGAWRVMLPVAPEVPDDEARSLAYAQRSLASVLPQGADAPIDHVAMYRAHQRVAATFRLGRVFLAGDAAHINNPLGGLGMNGGLHDALNLTERLGAVIHARCGQDALEGYDRQRRRVTTSAIQNEAIRNKTNLEARTVEVRRIFREGLQAAAADRAATRAFLRRISMIDSLEHAAAL